ncbi:MAG: type II toxin-antitoxin system VapC family toxin [Vicinamibacterales bacterium]
MLHLDTSFVVDLLRETARGRPGGALDFMETLDDDEILAVSVHVVCELRAGAELARQPLGEHEMLDRLLSGLLVVHPGDSFAGVYARTLAATRRTNHRLSAVDLLIATAALIDDAPLVTRNVKDFSRVPGLRVLRY